MDFRGISSQLMLMGTFPNEYKPIFQAFGHDYDPYSLATIGPFKADDSFPTQIKPVTRPDLEYVIPAGKVVTFKGIDKSADITIGGASEKIPVYGAGRESTKTRTYPSDTVADKDSWRGTDTIMGEIIPCAGWYRAADDGSGDPIDTVTGWDYGYGLKFGDYVAYDGTNYDSNASPAVDDLVYKVFPSLPIGIVVEPVRKWNNKSHLNYVDTPVYSVWRNGRLVLPYVDLIGIAQNIFGCYPGVVDVLNGSAEVISGLELSFVRGFAKISGLSTFLWGYSSSQNLAKQTYNLSHLIKPDIYGNYTVVNNDLFDYAGTNYHLLERVYRDHLIIGHINYIETVHPRDLMQYVDTDPRILIGTSAGGIEPFLAYFIHDFMVIMGEETGIDVSNYIKADGIASLVNNGYFAIADISLVFSY